MAGPSAQEPSTGSVRIVFEGEPLVARVGQTVLWAVWSSGRTLVTNVGCLGQGVCGSCAIYSRTSEGVSMELACERLVEEGLEVHFVETLEGLSRHRYSLDELTDGWRAPALLNERFPEAAHCRHCGGCDAACPRDLPVEAGVQAMVEGQLSESGSPFDACIMCELCTYVCPEQIAPNHLLLAARRMTAAGVQRPAQLIERLRELEAGLGRIQLPDQASLQNSPQNSERLAPPPSGKGPQ